MKKQEIIQALREAQVMYERAFNCRCRTKHIYLNMLVSNNMGLGFCFYFRHKYSLETKSEILEELLIEMVISFSNKLWYDVALRIERPSDIKDIKTRCILPRLEHLNRTIARLEAEGLEKPTFPEDRINTSML